MNEEICCTTNKRKTAQNERNSDDSDFLFALYCVCQKIRTILFPQLLITLFKQRYRVESKHHGLNFFKVLCINT